MDQPHPAAIGKSPAQDLCQSLVVGHRGATQELKALCKELQTLLDDLLSARPELHARHQGLMQAQLMVAPCLVAPGLVEQDHPEARVRRSGTELHQMSAAQCKRECERNLLKSAE